ncbi:jg20020 [Pararge aegeria aegeria]|uniref:Jg20020 protein n=1 Tax=Pararge aegeria aegeria TaxID=348720 RepID=A0A8S4R2T8_9NEOP|nr:jg20020 [Pararge aegeria aegeria]
MDTCRYHLRGFYGVTGGVGRARKLAMRRAPGLDDIGGVPAYRDVTQRWPCANEIRHNGALTVCFSSKLLLLSKGGHALNPSYMREDLYPAVGGDVDDDRHLNRNQRLKVLFEEHCLTLPAP